MATTKASGEPTESSTGLSNKQTPVESTKKPWSKRGFQKPTPRMTNTAPRQGKFEGKCDGLKDYIYDCSDMRQSDIYAKTTKEIAGYVGRTYKYGSDTAVAIENLSLPVLSFPAEPALNATESEKYVWRKRVDECLKQESYLIQNMKTLYALVWGQCTDVMIQKIEGTTEFETLCNDRDGLGLLKTIKNLVYNFQSQKYLPQALSESVRRLHNCVQTKHMTTQVFMERFQNLVDVIEYSGGCIGMHPGILKALFIEKQIDRSRLSDIEREEIEKEAQGRYLAMTFILNSDRNKYGKMLEDLENGYLHGVDNFPKTMTSAYNLLTNWKQDTRNMLRGPANDGVSFANVDNNVEEGGANLTFTTEGKKIEFPNVTCHRCNKKGHYANTCTAERLSSKQLLMAGVVDGEFESSRNTAFTFHSSGIANNDNENNDQSDDEDMTMHAKFSRAESNASSEMLTGEEDDVSDDGSMPELMDRGDISSSDDESEDETYYPEHPMAFVEPNNEDETFVNRYEPYGTVNEVNMISIESNMTITQRVNNGWKPNDDLETAMEQEWKEYEESMINETHETHQNN